MVAVPYSFLFLFSFFYSLFFYSLFFSSPNEAKITKNASEVLAQAKGRAMLGKVEKRAEELRREQILLEEAKAAGETSPSEKK
ncbi:hypothetical protein A2643_02390 [Candidatus Nomurabacteria bacterium RIFCSPHIGHO2_01_FULL_39_220]|uniref:Uncharacterized protein n=1 Tax=Candidatus Nomurabacteria bacterium RIFCSPLOWO2_02_FULL_40_67 TaxID=1801787 RepID=A0A1F6Y6Z3_9BACT|nr:MAG: hypothetical protein UU01_C0026G0003 [Parcubacteria group bacterium GW2011_GWA2_40_37]OGI61762.1 MAG: hypothetical protein A2W12_03715 [Candidatus Nomurabacteria bacterium RBG_16_40_11]OGI70574.1 MAG: hypothetical protein A2643_02390 [Candidatus Nomurabacteria bacterium RIFCSPHIGHO2_01_FULL_39_220]OGI72944.1 MAG: hypothetical protein A2W56_00560 [Candidatus Nomurabacteria bacterium RIFCSPHIGHO2_02_41_18]OGI78906.1 MAG: hypothetical protein A3C65_00920 [Candidatus Nomurabacteria bacteriu